MKAPAQAPPRDDLCLSPGALERLQARAVRAGLFDRAGNPDVIALSTRILDALVKGGDTPREAIHAVAHDADDLDMAAFMRLRMEICARAFPRRWAHHLVDRLVLDPATLLRLHARAERNRRPNRAAPDLALMASSELAIAFNGVAPSEPDLAAWMAAHPEPVMQRLFEALEHARAAARPN